MSGRTKKPAEAISSLGCCLGGHMETMNHYLEIISNNLSQGNVYNVSIQYICDDPDDTTTCHWVLVVEYANHSTQTYDIPCACGDTVNDITYDNTTGDLVITYNDGTVETYYIGIIAHIDYDGSTYTLTVTNTDGSTFQLHVVTDITTDSNGDLVITYGDGTSNTIPVGHLDSVDILYGTSSNLQLPSENAGRLTIVDDQNNAYIVYFGQITDIRLTGEGDLEICRICDGHELILPSCNPGEIRCSTIPLHRITNITCVDTDDDSQPDSLQITYSDGHTSYIKVCEDCGCSGGGTTECNTTPSMSFDGSTLNYTDCQGNPSSVNLSSCCSGGNPNLFRSRVVNIDNSVASTLYITQQEDGSGNVVEDDIVGIYIDDYGNELNVRRRYIMSPIGQAMVVHGDGVPSGDYYLEVGTRDHLTLEIQDAEVRAATNPLILKTFLTFGIVANSDDSDFAGTMILEGGTGRYFDNSAIDVSVSALARTSNGVNRMYVDLYIKGNDGLSGSSRAWLLYGYIDYVD